MKRTCSFVAAREVVVRVIEGARVVLPVFPGVLEHPSERELRALLADPGVARKYTRAALRKLPWQCLRQFERDWPRSCLAGSGLPDARLRALELLLAI